MSVTISTALFFIGSGLSFHVDNSRKRKEFDEEIAVKFEKGPFIDHLKRAKRENKKVFLDIYTAWCGPCLQFSRTVLSDKEVGKEMNKAFVNVKVDAEVGEGIEIGKKYTKGGYPTLLILNADGTVAEHLNPGWLPNKNQMKLAIKKYSGAK